MKFEFKFARPRASQETSALCTEVGDLGLSSSSSLRGRGLHTRFEPEVKDKLSFKFCGASRLSKLSLYEVKKDKKGGAFVG